MNGWYLVYCKHGKIRQSELSLERVGVTTFCPLIKTEKLRAGSNSKRIRIEPAFPPYLFVQFDPYQTQVAKIESSPGVNRLVSFGNGPKPLPQHVVDALMLQTHGHLDDDAIELGAKNINFLEVKQKVSNILASGNKTERSAKFISLLDNTIKIYQAPACTFSRG